MLLEKSFMVIIFRVSSDKGNTNEQQFTKVKLSFMGGATMLA